MFKRRDGYKLELKTPESMKLFGCREKLIWKTNNSQYATNL